MTPRRESDEPEYDDDEYDDDEHEGQRRGFDRMLMVVLAGEVAWLGMRLFRLERVVDQLQHAEWLRAGGLDEIASEAERATMDEVPAEVEPDDPDADRQEAPTS